MKIAKSLICFADLHGLQIAKVNFLSHGRTKTGFDVMYGNIILYTFEPCHYTNGDRWLITGLTDSWPYAKDIKSACKKAIADFAYHKTEKLTSPTFKNYTPNILYNGK